MHLNLEAERRLHLLEELGLLRRGIEEMHLTLRVGDRQDHARQATTGPDIQQPSSPIGEYPGERKTLRNVPGPELAPRSRRDEVVW